MSTITGCSQSGGEKLNVTTIYCLQEQGLIKNNETWEEQGRMTSIFETTS
jgi:hypothetical protein